MNEQRTAERPAARPRLGALALLQQQSVEPPRFADARVAVRRAFREVLFPEKLTVLEAANKHRNLRNPGGYSGSWKDSPESDDHLDDPMNALAMSDPCTIVAVIGPSQTGKSEIGNNWQVHSVLYDPADIGFWLCDKNLIHSYVTTQIDKLLDECPDVKARQQAGASADNIHLKQFKGCDWHFLWPTGPNFRARPFSRGRLDDYDDFDDDIGGQGDAVSLFKGRTNSFLSYGWKLYVNSSPKKGAKKGIEPLVAGGTSKKRWVDCLHCSEPFQLCHERLSFDRSGTVVEARNSACVVCPTCGGVHVQTDKPMLLATGRWIGKGETAVSLSTGSNGGKVGELEPNTVDSYWFEGIFGFAPWPDLAERERQAELAFEEHQDEEPLRAYWNTQVGRNYVSKSSGDAPVSEDALIERAKASTYRMGEVPDGVVALTATVDLGQDRFSVLVAGHGVGNRAWIIDRFDILTLDDGITKLDPFRRREHWAVLYEKVLRRTYPLQRDPSLRMRILNTGVDTGGQDDATDNAYDWWGDMMTGDRRSGRPALPATVITLLKGGNRPKGRLLPPPTVDAKRQMDGAPECELWVPNVNRLKDMLDYRLRRPEPGASFVALPREFGERPGDRFVKELRAEEKVEGQWQKGEGVRNETWDLLVYSLAVMLRLVGLDQNLTKVPLWARPPRPTGPTPASSDPGEGPVAAVETSMVSVSRPSGPTRPKPRRSVRTVRSR
jgi:phage terminase large subunit GpA-like protein